MRPLALFVLCAGLLGAAGCGGDEGSRALPEGRFVASEQDIQPRVALFADPIVARVDLIVDSERYDPERVRVTAEFDPWERTKDVVRTRKDLGRYMRNSPIFYVERVETPVMIVQGDLDYVAIQQGEEFFTSLYRQGKRAEFVRYWGEGHVLESPANIRDMWARIETWLDEFGDVTRDGEGRLQFDGDRLRSRKPKSDEPPKP